MGIGMGECRADRCPSNDPVDQLAQRRSQAATSFDERVRTAHLVEQHHHELAPGAEAISRIFDSMLSPSSGEVHSIAQGEHVRRATGDAYHTASSAAQRTNIVK